MKTLLFTVAAMIIVIIVAGSACATTYFVKPPPAGSDANSGLSWALAKATVSGAIAVATTGDEIWVAAGTYPEHIRNRTAGENSVDVKLYGGFNGTETLLGQRNPTANPTILDGGGGEPPIPPESGSVITITGGAGPGMVIDGFTIIHGHAYLGGGISMVGSAPTISNNHIKDNTAHVGAGIYIGDYKNVPPVANPVISSNLIDLNFGGDGGGIAVSGSAIIADYGLPSAAPLIRNNYITGNVANGKAGGIGSWGHASPFIANNVIRANAANYDETSSTLGGGGIYSTADDLSGRPVAFAIAAPTIINNVIAANGADNGGGICFIDYRPAPDPELTPPPKVINNTIVANNGAGIYWDNAFPLVSNNLVAFNTWGLQQGTIGTSTPAIRYNDVFGNTLQGNRTDYQEIEDRTGISGNISADPLATNAAIGNYNLRSDSPCINKGLSGDVNPAWTDMDGLPRVVGAAVDIGADEWDGTVWSVPTPVYYVSPAGSDGDGLTWGTAKKTLQGGIYLAAVTGGEVWVAKATYHEHIRIPAYVYLYGGFAGTETARSQRNIAGNPTTIDGDGIPNVVYSAYAGYLVSALDGFTVQNGGTYTNGNTGIPGDAGSEGRGGGVVSRVSSLILQNCAIRRNSLGNPFDNANKLAYGGGLFGYLSYSLVRGNAFVENELLNTFDGSGAGAYFVRSAPTIDGNIFSNNRAKYGAAIYAYRSTPHITRNTITNNSFYNSYPLPVYLGAISGAVALDLGPGFLIEGNLIWGNKGTNGAGINVSSNFSGTIRNNFIGGNSTLASDVNMGMGGGIYCMVQDSATDTTRIVNNTIVGNTASTMPGTGQVGGGIAISLPAPLPPPPTPPAGKLVIGNNIIAHNSSGIFQQPSPTGNLVPTLTDNDLFDNGGANYVSLSPGASDIAADPLFVDRPHGDYHLQASSPCVDSGSNSLVPAGATDYAGKPRIVDGKHSGTPVVDMGALELMAIHALTVTIGGTGKGSVTISPPPTACSVSCTNSFASDSPLTGHASPDQYSLFDGWSGGGCSGTADCIFSLLTDTTLGAGFTLDTLHSVLGGTGANYASLQAAYDAALNGEVVKAWGIEFRENLACRESKRVTLKGGWNSGYTVKSGPTILTGTLSIIKGSLTVEDLVIR